MAGTLFGIPLSQRFDANGKLLIGGRLYIYAAGTTNPASIYRDTALSVALPNPLTTSAYGTVPQFWLADGSYRARLTDSFGTVVFDEDYIVALGPSSGGGGGGGGGSADPTALFQTGDTLWNLSAGSRLGWVRANNRTIGAATSGADERSNADCQNLFTFLWQNFDDAQCTVIGGRGASAAADWAANKRICTPDLRGRAPFGLDDMGNSGAGVLHQGIISYGSPTTRFSSGGSDSVFLSIDQIPPHSHGVNFNDPGHNHAYTNASRPGGGFGGLAQGSGLSPYLQFSPPVDTGTSTSGTGISVSIQNNGGGNWHNNMPPFALGTWYMKL